MPIISAGADFCKVLRSTSGNQVLLTLEQDTDGTPYITMTTTLEVDGNPCLVSDNAGIEPVVCPALIRGPITAQQELELADMCVQKLSAMLVEAVRGGMPPR